VARTPFEVIEGGPAVKPRRKPSPRTRTVRIWECRICYGDIGVKTRTLMKTKFGAEEDGQLRIANGRDTWVCVHCLARGKVTYSDR
jgi:hypothetical protein